MTLCHILPAAEESGKCIHFAQKAEVLGVTEKKKKWNKTVWKKMNEQKYKQNKIVNKQKEKTIGSFSR